MRPNAAATVADKVRGVRFAVRAGSPVDRKSHYLVMTSEKEENDSALRAASGTHPSHGSHTDYESVSDNGNPNALSPY